MIKCVIFDLDDTLYNERTYVECAMLNVSGYFHQKYGLDTDNVYAELMCILDKSGRGKVFDEFMAKHDIDEDVMNIVSVYRDTRPSLELYDDARDIIDELRSRNILLGIITDGCSQVQHNKVSGLNIWEIFDDIVITDDYDNAAKPSTVPYKMILEKHKNINASECIYIGDNPNKDFVGAKELGMATARIIRNVGQHMNTQVSADLEADISIHSLLEILMYL